MEKIFIKAGQGHLSLKKGGGLISFKQEGGWFQKWPMVDTKRAPRRVESIFFAADTGQQFSKSNQQGGWSPPGEHWVTEWVPKASPFLPISQLPDLVNIINLEEQGCTQEVTQVFDHGACWNMQGQRCLCQMGHSHPSVLEFPRPLSGTAHN